MNRYKQPDNHCVCAPDNPVVTSCNNEPAELHLCPYKESNIAGEREGEYCTCCLDCTAECEGYEQYDH